MKKTFLGIAGVLSVLTVLNANAATNSGARAASSANLSGAPATRTREKVNYQKYQTRTTTKTYESKDTGDLYYTKPANRSALYKQYEGANSSSARATKTTKRTTRSEKVVNKLTRKYFIAHPFYQPLGGVFGSVTDLGYTMGSYDFTINQTVPVYDISSGTAVPVYPLNGLGGKWDMTRLSIKEDFSYGITDTIAVMGMAEFDMDDYKFEWEDNSPSDEMDDSGLNLFGIGGQWRFIDNEKWIGMASAYYQHQQDISNNFLLEAKFGYKIASSTVYGLARGWYLALDGNSYGNGVEGTDANGVPALMYIPYQVGDDKAMYFEGGMGVFSVLNKDWTLNLEGVFGHYDWHNSATIKGAIGWQPNDWFALNLYAKTVFYDSADGKELDLFWMEPSVGLEALTKIGTVDLDKYSETSIGLQVMFQF
ncbi:MAG: hypothetical protein J6R52_00830 [Alphaproteobacteria bacterium]|jgi:hypothetical protein|nr:hypothetical protein [Alphaproteobacteria bacterium]